MPTYVYSCECGKKTEVFHSMTAEVQVACPDCLKEMSRKPQVSLVKIVPTGFGGMG